MADEGDVRIDKDIVDWMFENEMEESKIGFIAKFKISDKVLIHRCSSNTVGLLLHGHQAVFRWQGYPMHGRILQEQI